MPLDIDRSEATDRWRFVCPSGHRTWEPMARHFWCKSCADAARSGPGGPDPTFDALRDTRTGDLLEREEVRFVEEPGEVTRP